MVTIANECRPSGCQCPCHVRGFTVSHVVPCCGVLPVSMVGECPGCGETLCDGMCMDLPSQSAGADTGPKSPR